MVYQPSAGQLLGPVSSVRPADGTGTNSRLPGMRGPLPGFSVESAWPYLRGNQLVFFTPVSGSNFPWSYPSHYGQPCAKLCSRQFAFKHPFIPHLMPISILLLLAQIFKTIDNVSGGPVPSSRRFLHSARKQFLLELSACSKSDQSVVSFCHVPDTMSRVMVTTVNETWTLCLWCTVS